MMVCSSSRDEGSQRKVRYSRLFLLPPPYPGTTCIQLTRHKSTIFFFFTPTSQQSFKESFSVSHPRVSSSFLGLLPYFIPLKHPTQTILAASYKHSCVQYLSVSIHYHQSNLSQPSLGVFLDFTMEKQSSNSLTQQTGLLLSGS